MANELTPDEIAEAAAHFGLSFPEKQPAQEHQASVLSPNEIAEAANHFGISPQQDSSPAADMPPPQDFWAQLGGLAHGVAQGAYRTADVVQAPIKGISANLYRGVTGQEPQESTYDQDFSKLFPMSPNQAPLAQSIGKTLAPSAVANFILPGSGLVKYAGNGALGSGLTSATEQMAEKKNIDPGQLAFDAATGAATNAGMFGLGKVVTGGIGKLGKPAVPISAAEPTGLKLNVTDPTRLESDDLLAYNLRKMQQAGATQAPSPTVSPELSSALPAEPNKLPVANQPLLGSDPLHGLVAASPELPGFSRLERTRAARIQQAPTQGVPPTMGAAPPPSTPTPPAPPTVSAEQPNGPYRLRTDKYGFDRIRNAQPVDSFFNSVPNGPKTEELRAGISRLANAYAEHKLTEAHAENFGDRLIDQFGQGADHVVHDGVTVTRNQTEKLKRKFAAVIAKVRAHYAEPPDLTDERKHIATTLGSDFGHNPDQYRMFPEPIPSEASDAVKRYSQLEGAGKIAKDNYDRIRNELQPLFEDMDAGVGMKALRTQIRHPLGENNGTLEAFVEFRHNPTGTKIMKSAVARVDAWRKAYDVKLANLPAKSYTNRIKISGKGAGKFLSLVGPAMMTMDQRSEAATGKAQEGNHFMRAAGEAATIAGLTIAFGPKAMQQLLKAHDGLGAVIASVTKDTLDHLEFLDTLMDKTGKGIVNDILMHNAAALQSNLRVKFDNPSEKAEAYEYLKKGVISAVQALHAKEGNGLPVQLGLNLGVQTTEASANIAADTKKAIDLFRKLTPEQVGAIVDYHLSRQTLASKLVEHKQNFLNHAAQNNIDTSKIGIRGALDALDYAIHAVRPQGGKPTNQVDALMGNMLGNSFDYYFAANPKMAFNLFDQLTVGSSRVGTTNIVKANALLATDKELGALFKDSNLAGGWHAERNAQAAATGRKGFSLPTTDKINGDRVILASLLKQFNDNADQLKPLFGDDVAFAKAMINGSAEHPEIVMQSWMNAGEIAMRTLGLDAYRVNADIVSRSVISKSAALFTRMPAIQAHALVSNISKGNWTGVANQLFWTTALGGRAVIPVEIRGLWALLDQDAYLEACKSFDELDQYRRLTGQTITSKTDYSLIPGVQSSSNIAVEAARGFGDQAGNLITLAHDLGKFESWQDVVDDGKALGAAKRLFGTVAALCKPFVKGVPIAESMRIENALEQVATNKVRVSYGAAGGRPLKSSESLNAAENHISPFRILGNAIMPGELAEVDALKQSAQEHALRKLPDFFSALAGTGKNQVYPSEQIYNNGDIRNRMRTGRDPLADLVPQ